MAIDVMSSVRTIAATASRVGAGAPGIGSAGSGASLPSVGGGAGQVGGGVGASFSDLLSGVEETAAQANTAVANMVNKTGDVHDAMIALQRSEMALELTVQVRNKFVAAYQDIMRMPI